MPWGVFVAFAADSSVTHRRAVREEAGTVELLAKVSPAPPEPALAVTTTLMMEEVMGEMLEQAPWQV